MDSIDKLKKLPRKKNVEGEENIKSNKKATPNKKVKKETVKKSVKSTPIKKNNEKRKKTLSINKNTSDKSNREKNDTPDLMIENEELTTENQYEARIFKDGAIEEVNSRLNKIFLLIVLSIFIVFLGASKNATVAPDFAYIPVDDEFKIVYGLGEEGGFTPADVVDFTNKAMEETFSFNYMNYNRRLQHIYNEYYTRNGARSLDRALSRRDFFRFLSNRSLTLVESRVLENALILREGVSDNGLPAWVLEIQIELTLLTSQERRERYTYEVIVEQMHVQERRGQLGISSIQQR